MEAGVSGVSGQLAEQTAACGGAESAASLRLGLEAETAMDWTCSL
ncbi:hypothetical protein SKAU_G00228630 [Synaphobranchus kaupii]|uniref:Uncharacterized protein n=1 Tax=Synaphobranchus kaupii TaxID=118154 RepID=A0A9Q1ISS0_SYNKA|nr:hypothetical protein SKAU_G00228630 [Synaphobranchus kaupii]